MEVAIISFPLLKNQLAQESYTGRLAHGVNQFASMIGESLILDDYPIGTSSCFEMTIAPGLSSKKGFIKKDNVVDLAVRLAVGAFGRFIPFCSDMSSDKFASVCIKGSQFRFD